MNLDSHIIEENNTVKTEKKESFSYKILNNRLYVFGILLLFAFIVYAKAINGPLIFDDEHFIEKNEYVHSFDIAKIYNSSVTEGAKINGNFYRPNQQLTYSLVYQVFKLNPIPYHLLNILFHVFNAFLIFLLLMKLNFHKGAAFVASLLFLIHPVQTEAISYISGLADPLGLFFILAGLNLLIKTLYLKDQRSFRISMAKVLILFVTAFFCKENMVVLLPLVFIIGIYIYYGSTGKILVKRLYSIFGLVSIITIAYIFIKFTYFTFSVNSLGLTEAENLYTSSLKIRIFTFISILPEYIKLIFFPKDLFYEKAYDPHIVPDLLSFKFFFGLLLLFSLLLFTIRFFKRKKNKKVFLGLAIFFSSLLPFTGIIPLNAMFLEHWLYIPMIGFVILVATLFEFVIEKKQSIIMLVILIPIMLVLSLRTISRNSEWADIEKFYLNELEYTNNSVRINNNLGMYYSHNNNNEKALFYYREAIAIVDIVPQPHYNIALIYINQEKFNDAILELHKSLVINPDFIYSLDKLFEVFINTGQKIKAQKMEIIIKNNQAGIRTPIEDIESIIFSNETE